MSILFENEAGWIICHANLIKSVYNETHHNGKCHSYEINSDIFQINSAYKRPNIQEVGVSSTSSHRKRKRVTNDEYSDEVELVKRLYLKIYENSKHIFGHGLDKRLNSEALITAEKFYTCTTINHFVNTSGGNTNDYPIVQSISDNEYLFPANSNFHCKDVRDLDAWAQSSRPLFDIILLDPPWWNKYIRRKKAKVSDHSYQMMYNADLQNLPIKKLLSLNGLVIIWCTNSKTHINAIKNEFFPLWNVKYLATWYWLKVTKQGEPVCNFAGPSAKQPFEQIVIGGHVDGVFTVPPDDRLIVSIPSALHSHKPPLIDILKNYLPEQAKCLEIFARYLLPNWTSWGTEVCKWQSLSLYKTTD